MIDNDALIFFSGKFIIGMLIFVRLSGMFVSAPFYRHAAIPPLLKIIIAIILATSITGAYWNEQPVIDFHLWNLVFLIFKEFTVGLIIGFSANVVFWAARMAGGLIDFDMGYQTAMLFTNDESPTLVGEFNDMIVLMIFLFVNGHHHLIEAMYASIRAVPLTTFEISESTVTLLMRLATTSIIIGIKMAAPVLVALFMTNLALVLLARVAPQTNIFVLSFQLKIAIGLLTLLVSVPLMVMVAKYSLEMMETETMKVIMSMNPLRSP